MTDLQFQMINVEMLFRSAAYWLALLPSPQALNSAAMQPYLSVSTFSVIYELYHKLGFHLSLSPLLRI